MFRWIGVAFFIYQTSAVGMEAMIVLVLVYPTCLPKLRQGGETGDLKR